jgi:hypothetical protein
MEQGRGGLEEDHPVKSERWWGLRPWKRHSTILMVVGFLYVLIGIQYMLAGPSPARELALAAVLRVAPLDVWGGVFAVVGVLSIISSRWPPLAETWGYMVLSGLSSGWAGAYLTGIAIFKSPITNITQVILWFVLAFMWWAISGFPNPPERKQR